MAQEKQHETSPELLGDEVLVRSEGVVEAEVDGEQILLSPVDFSYFGLTGTGAQVWALIDGARTLDDIIGLLQAEYEADHEEIQTDVVSFVAALKSSGLII